MKRFSICYLNRLGIVKPALKSLSSSSSNADGDVASCDSVRRILKDEIGISSEYVCKIYAEHLLQ